MARHVVLFKMRPGNGVLFSENQCHSKRKQGDLYVFSHNWGIAKIKYVVYNQGLYYILLLLFKWSIVRYDMNIDLPAHMHTGRLLKIVKTWHICTAFCG